MYTEQQTQNILNGPRKAEKDQIKLFETKRKFRQKLKQNSKSKDKLTQLELNNQNNDNSYFIENVSMNYFHLFYLFDSLQEEIIFAVAILSETFPNQRHT